MKYAIRARIEVDGVVEKPDIIGAIFGQTEGLFGPEYDLKELQDKGRIGRILVEIKQSGNKTVGEILIPSNLDKVETALIAAMIENVDRVGPYQTRIKVVEIVDLRQEKIKKITERAKEILEKWLREKPVDVKEILAEIESSVKVAEVIEYGPEKLPAGPEVETSDTLIIVEGRADVLNLLKYGYKNVIAVEGAKGEIPQSVIELSKKKKKVIAFVDGDRMGLMIVKNLAKAVKIDSVARAPPGREVEELTGKEIAKALKNATPLQTFLQLAEAPQAEEVEEETKVEKAEVKEVKPVNVPEAEAVPKPEVIETYQIPSQVVENLNSLKGSLEAVLYDENWNILDRVPVKDLVDYLLSTDKQVYAVFMDGVATQRLVDAASVKNVKLLVSARISSITKKPLNLTILTFDELLQ